MTALHWLNAHKWLGVPLSHWALAIGIAIGCYIIVFAALRFLASRLRKRAARHERMSAADVVAAALHQTHTQMLLLLFLLVAIHALDLADKAELWLSWAAYAIGGLQLGFWLSTAVKVWSKARLAESTTGAISPIVLSMLAWFVRILIWVVIALAVLGTMGMDVTAFIASLGVGGIAVALGLQTVLKDLFASLSIGLDKPFEIGDFLIFGDSMGTVTKVGVKTTRIRTLHGEELSIANHNLLDKTIHNYGRMATRRMVMDFRIALDTPREKLAQVADTVREIIEATAEVTFDRSNFLRISDSSYDFEAVYICQDPNNNKSLDTQQAINLAVLERLHAMGIYLAVPTNTQFELAQRIGGPPPAPEPAATG